MSTTLQVFLIYSLTWRYSIAVVYNTYTGSQSLLAVPNIVCTVVSLYLIFFFFFFQCKVSSNAKVADKLRKLAEQALTRAEELKGQDTATIPDESK